MYGEIPQIYAGNGGTTDTTHRPDSDVALPHCRTAWRWREWVVYKAEDTRLGRFVALKFLSPEGQRDAYAQARFQREAQAASALNHHNICTVYDIGEQDSQTFIAMELLEGQTLKQKIGSRPLPVEPLLDYALQISVALEVAHKNRIVHRDVKPSNIFVTSRGEIKLADFGLAKHVILDGTPIGEAPTISAPITERGAIVGTVAYMSPEQAEDKDIDARSDIFSFGIVSMRWRLDIERFRVNLP